MRAWAESDESSSAEAGDGAIRGADDDRGLHAHGGGGGSEVLGKLLDDNDPAARKLKKRGWWRK
jgi:hypothetical protein